MTHPIRNARLLLLPLAAFSFAAVFETSAADLDGRLPKAITRPVDFVADVKPLLERSCVQCHSGEKPKGKFSVESRDGILKGGESKEASIVPGGSGSSAL